MAGEAVDANLTRVLLQDGMCPKKMFQPQGI